MPIVPASEAAQFEVHGSGFKSFVSPSRGSRELCAWRLTVPEGLIGAEHRPTRDEVLILLHGDIVITLDGQSSHVIVGEVVLVPANTTMRVDGRCVDRNAAGNDDARSAGSAPRRVASVATLGDLIFDRAS